MPLIGTAHATRSSAAAIQNVAAPPPEIPVTPIRAGSTSGRLVEVVDRPEPVPALDARGSVPGCLPPPTAITVRAVMRARQLAELQGVDDQADVSVPGIPHPVLLEPVLQPSRPWGAWPQT